MQTREPDAWVPQTLSDVRVVLREGEEYYLGVDLARYLQREPFNLYKACARKKIKTDNVHWREMVFQKAGGPDLGWRSGGRRMKIIHKQGVSRYLNYLRKRPATKPKPYKPYSLWCCEEFVALVTAATTTRTATTNYPWTADKLSTPVWSFTDWSQRRINSS